MATRWHEACAMLRPDSPGFLRVRAMRPMSRKSQQPTPQVHLQAWAGMQEGHPSEPHPCREGASNRCCSGTGGLGHVGKVSSGLILSKPAHALVEHSLSWGSNPAEASDAASSFLDPGDPSETGWPIKFTAQHRKDNARPDWLVCSAASWHVALSLRPSLPSTRERLRMTALVARHRL